MALLPACLLLSTLFAAAHSLSVDSVSGKQLAAQLMELAKLSDDPSPAVTRILFTEHDMKARSYVKGLMKEAGLGIREDAMGNIFGRWEGSDRSAGAVVTGSHCDAIPLAGAYDGTLGVLGGIAAVQALRKAGFTPSKPLEVLFFTSEEPTRFGLGCIGSRGLAGQLTAATLDKNLDENGTSFQTAATEAGYGGKSHKDILDKTRLPKAAISAFVELHIEQGPFLEREGLQLGVVTAIAAPAALRVKFTGEGGHAGGLLMPARHDAGLAAAELALEVERAVKATGSIDTVGTTGRVALVPNLVNSVPRQATLEIDVRDTDGARRDRVVAAIRSAVEAIAKGRGVQHSSELVNQDPPATCSDQVVAAADAAAKQLGVKAKRLVSRAYHDSLFMAQLGPAGMIFIPCRQGWSHRPDEFASEADMEVGVKALALTLASLAGPGSSSHSTEL